MVANGARASFMDDQLQRLRDSVRRGHHPQRARTTAVSAASASATSPPPSKEVVHTLRRIEAFDLFGGAVTADALSSSSSDAAAAAAASAAAAAAVSQAKTGHRADFAEIDA
eukprot:Rhum_TRINITY_DN23755_c0_g1::Rhum_TRINITY_DN23755_c0_g1_i1::g.178570::m.178570